MANFAGWPSSAPIDTTTREATQSLPLGTRLVDGSGNEFTYVKVAEDIAAMAAVTFSTSATSAGYDTIEEADAVNEYVLGVATAAFDYSEAPYGFIQTKGVCSALVVDATADQSVLVSSASSGVLKLATEAESLAGNRPAVVLVSGASSSTAGATIYLG